MRRELPDGYELDDDRARVDVNVVHRYLAEEAYWVPGRDRATIERLVRESARVIGAYHGREQVGFARVMSDGSSIVASRLELSMGGSGTVVVDDEEDVEAGSSPAVGRVRARAAGWSSPPFVTSRPTSSASATTTAPVAIPQVARGRRAGAASEGPGGGASGDDGRSIGSLLRCCPARSIRPIGRSGPRLELGP